jgi:hypothetical protein
LFLQEQLKDIIIISRNGFPTKVSAGDQPFPDPEAEYSVAVLKTKQNRPLFEISDHCGRILRRSRRHKCNTTLETPCKARILGTIA